MSTGGDFGNPLRKFKLVFLGEQSGECAAPPLLAAACSVPAPPPARPFLPRRLPAGLAFALGSAPSPLPGSPTPLSHRCLFASTRQSDFDPFVPASGVSFPRSPASFRRSPSSAPSPLRPAPASCPSLSSLGLRRLTHPAPFLEPHPYSWLLSQRLGSVRPTLAHSREPGTGNQPPAALGQAGGIWALFSPEAGP